MNYIIIEELKQINNRIHKLQQKANIYNDLEEYLLFDNVLSKIFLLSNRKIELETEIDILNEKKYCKELLRRENRYISGTTAHKIAKNRLTMIKIEEELNKNE